MVEREKVESSSSRFICSSSRPSRSPIARQCRARDRLPTRAFSRACGSGALATPSRDPGSCRL